MVQLSPGGAFEILQPLVLFIAGLAFYAIIVYNLYKLVATRDIFKLNLRKYNTAENPSINKFFAILLYTVEYILFFPLFLMLWFIIFSAIFIALSNMNDIGSILIISMSMISAIRIASYYKQDLARDIAKLIPFALLAVFLIDGASAFSWEQSWYLIISISSMLDTLIYYFIFVFILELTLRVIYSISKALSPRDE
jgi:hypothetical protein